MSLDYEIHDIAGELNILADLLSRRRSTFSTVAAICLVLLPSSPQLDESFVWHTIEQIKVAQTMPVSPQGPVSDSGSVLRDSDGRIWLPAYATDLHLRISSLDILGLLDTDLKKHR
ncbi:hypothetical protein CCR75_009272 [Bremia lactucae]|uniref:Uncharacterized protein n=1 Tax=Bremia lactucae TaxID=4779 RepID=A0A976FEQ1_BRELC|nr:hypothetical protein CCR75_009272 [Bremia lactucae]